MRIRFLAAVLVCCSLLHAQQVPTLEPQYSQEYNALVGDRLLVLERQTAVTDTKSKRFFVVTPSTKVFESISKPASPVRVGPNVHFVVRLNTGDRDPQTFIHLHKVTPGKTDRQVPIVTYKVSLIPGGGVNHKRAPDEPIAVTIQKYGRSLEIIPQQPLEPGEYAFINGHEAQCFGVDASDSGTPSAAPATTAKAQPAVWKLKAVEHPQAITDIYEATLAGTSEAAGKRGPAQLDISCRVDRFTGPPGTQALASAVLKVRREIVAFPTDALTCQGDGAYGAPFLRSQLGTGTEQTRNLCFDEDLSTDPRAVTPFGLSYEEPLIISILQAAGETLTLRVRPQSGSPDALTSIFPLPGNGPDVLGLFDPCLKAEEAQRKREADAIVVACAELPGKHLSGVDVLVGAAMRKLATNSDNDIGLAWDMPKATKAHPALPKLTLACSYKEGTDPETDPTPTTKAVSSIIERKLLPIPATAKSCVFREDPNTNAHYGNCSRE